MKLTRMSIIREALDDIRRAPRLTLADVLLAVALGAAGALLLAFAI